MKINKEIFREYDIRGIYGTDIDENISYLIVIVGYQNLNNSLIDFLYNFLVVRHTYHD